MNAANPRKKEWCKMLLTINPRTGKGWTDSEEAVISEIMLAENCDRMEAIRCARRRRRIGSPSASTQWELPTEGASSVALNSPVGVLIRQIIEKRPGTGYEEARIQANALLDRAAGKKIYRMPVILTVEEERARNERLRLRFRTVKKAA